MTKVQWLKCVTGLIDRCAGAVRRRRATAKGGFKARPPDTCHQGQSLRAPLKPRQHVELEQGGHLRKHPHGRTSSHSMFGRAPGLFQVRMEHGTVQAYLNRSGDESRVTMANRSQQKPSREPGARLTPEAIVEAALRIADEAGDPQVLTMRGLAAELGVGVMTLYTYFRNKEEIFDAMADHVLGSLKFDEASPDPASAIRTFAAGMIRAMQEHPSVALLLGSRLIDNENALYGSMEIPLHRLVSAGIPGPLAARCYGTIVVFAIGFSSYRVARPWGRGERHEEMNEQRRQRVHHYVGRSITKFPTVVRLANEIVDIPSERTFEFGIEAIVGEVLRELEKASTDR